MPKIILQPCASKDSKEHYHDTIENPVILRDVTEFLSNTEIENLENIYPDGNMRVWGVTPGANGKNIGKLEVLLEIVEQIGLSVENARRVIHDRTFKKAVDEDWRKSRLYGITGVPTFVAAGRGIVGAQSYETLAHFMESLGAKEREKAL